MNSNEFWTGLHNPERKKCYDAECVDKLKWDSDGSKLTWANPNHGLYVNEQKPCLRYMSSIQNDHWCGNEYYYICEFKCPPTPSTTTTTTTTTTATTTLSEDE